MTLAARHLQTRRPRKDRDVTWSRMYDRGRERVIWTLWRRDRRRALHYISVTVGYLQLKAAPWTVGHDLRVAHRKLRDFVDEIDLRAMEETA